MSAPVELFADLFDHQPSQATLVKANEDCYENLKSVEEEIKEQSSPLLSPILTKQVCALMEKGGWLHVASTKTQTYYAAHQNRGQEATNDLGILLKISRDSTS